MKKNKSNTAIQRQKDANRVTIIGSIYNLILSLGKLFAGIAGQSHAMIADAVHSFSDIGTDIAVIVGIHFSSQPEDKKHNYGHGKFETFATLFISVTLISVGAGLGYSGFEKIVDMINGKTISQPGYIALFAAVSSIIIKEGLYRYTLKEGKRINSMSVIANAYHHRSDAYSSIGTGAGIAGAVLLGQKWVILDPIAAVIVSLLILKEALKIGYISISELLETSISEEDQKKIIAISGSHPEVFDPHKLKTRRIGNSMVVDLHIRVKENISVKEGHQIAHEVENKLKNEFGTDLLCSIHVEPQK